MRILSGMLLYCLVGGAVSAEYAPSTVEMTLQRVSEHVYYVQGVAGVATDNEGFISNAAAVVTPEGIVVIDALGSPSLAQKFLSLIRTVSPLPVVKLILTHYHADHIYGIQLFKDLGAEVVAPAGYHEYLDSEYAKDRLEERRFSLSPWVSEETRLVAPDVVIDHDAGFELGGVRFEMSYFGEAHSDGDLAVRISPDRVLVSGDIIFEGRVPFTGSADTGHWLDVLERLNAVDLAALIPGHGPAATDPNGAIQRTLGYLASLRETMAVAVEEMIPFDEAFHAADWSRFEKLPAFEAAHRRNAYGVYLSLEEEQFQ